MGDRHETDDKDREKKYIGAEIIEECARFVRQELPDEPAGVDSLAPENELLRPVETHNGG